MFPEIPNLILAIISLLIPSLQIIHQRLPFKFMSKVLCAFSQLDPSKAPQLNGIPSILLQKCTLELTPILHNMFYRLSYPTATFSPFLRSVIFLFHSVTDKQSLLHQFLKLWKLSNKQPHQLEKETNIMTHMVLL